MSLYELRPCPYCGLPSSQMACRCHLDLLAVEPYDAAMIAALEREAPAPAEGTEA